MATPIPPKSHPSHHQAMTPSSMANHLSGLSPLPTTLPRSIGQSPAQLSKKSPAHAAAQHAQFLRRSHSGNHTTTTTAAGAAAPPLTYDSPMAAALGLNLHLPGLDGMSTNVMHVRGAGAVSRDELYKRRLEIIVQRLRSRVGRVSEDGLERLAKRTDLECLWEDGPQGARTLTMAGTGVLLEIELRRRVVTRVAVSFPMTSETVTAVAPRAEKILQRALMRSEVEKITSGINHSLAPFAAHLERLTMLDKLSSTHLNCYEAVAGVYDGLRRIFAWEKQRVREAWGRGDDKEEAVEREVLCRKSGRPRMHAGDRLGLSFEYWMPRRYVGGKKRKRGEDGDEKEDEDGKTWAAIIECEAAPAELFPPVRISRDWVSDKVVRAAGPGDLLSTHEGGGAQEVIDWLEPPPTYVPAEGDATTDGTAAAAAAATTGNAKLPDVRFVATFEPPVIVPLHVAYQVYMSVGQQIPQEPLLPHTQTYDEMILSGKGVKRSVEDGITKVMVENRRVAVFGGDEHEKNEVQSWEEHRYELYIAKPEYAQVISSLPFAHPRQLVGILPILRQYAILSEILQNTMSPSPVSSEPQRSSLEKPSQAATQQEYRTKRSNPQADLQALLSDENEHHLKKGGKGEEGDEDESREKRRRVRKKQVDMVLSTHPPGPKLAVVVPLSSRSSSGVSATTTTTTNHPAANPLNSTTIENPSSAPESAAVPIRPSQTQLNPDPTDKTSNAAAAEEEETKERRRLGHIVFEMNPNGRIQVRADEQDIIMVDVDETREEDEEGKGEEERPGELRGPDDQESKRRKTEEKDVIVRRGVEKMVQAMEVCTDVGIWLEFVETCSSLHSSSVHSSSATATATAAATITAAEMNPIT